ncbi:unnamed protein product [Penicillium camemberti]|uniref:Str. FM013 n=1 Tax=Penicillium camemberti (strain FM 013) TaxID=1429867 RepID=A0A0G4PJT1_PENC3|nr:unnamed protein product [Penicillium camemberti]
MTFLAKKYSICGRIYPDHSCCWPVRHHRHHHHPVAQSTQVERRH